MRYPQKHPLQNVAAAGRCRLLVDQQFVQTGAVDLLKLPLAGNPRGWRHKKRDAALRNLLQYACPKQNVNIAVKRADVAFRPTSYLANSYRSVASHQLKESPAFVRERLPKKILRRK